jgi:hypothetical protein
MLFKYVGIITILFFALSSNSRSAPDAGSLLQREKELQQQQNLPRSIPKSLIENQTNEQNQKKVGDKILAKE